MRAPGRWSRPPALLAILVSVWAWSPVPPSSPGAATPTPRVWCVLRAGPGVHHSYVAPPPPGAGNARVDVTYEGSFVPEARSAFQFAANLWASQLTSPVPIQVKARFSDLGPGVLGRASVPASFSYPFPSLPGTGKLLTVYPYAILNRFEGYDSRFGEELTVTLNTRGSYYYGTDGVVPPGLYDFVTVVLHELGHGLGFEGVARMEFGDTGAVRFFAEAGMAVFIYDHFATDASGGSILNLADPSRELGAVLTSDALFFSGPFVRAMNGGAPARLYAPRSFVSGSSYGHLNESSYTAGTVNSLMTPFLESGEAVHNPGPIARGMLLDMGWDPAIAPRCTYNLSANQSAFAAAGGSGTVSVAATASDCSWRAGSSAAWLGINVFGRGSQSATFTVAPATSSLTRTGTINVEGRALAITQSGVPCTYALGADLITYGAGGGTAPLAVTANVIDCAYASSPSAPWLSASGTHTGSSTITIQAAAAGGSTRAATVNVAGHPVTVRQNGHDTPTFDVNHDGAGDLVAYDPTSGSRFFALGDPKNLGFAAGAASPWSPGWTIHPGDFNGDGRGDLFFYNPITGRAIKARSTAPETFAYTEFAWTAGWQVTVADFNGDGIDDLFLYNPTTGIGSRCTSQVDGGFSFCSGWLWGTNWSIFPGDFNGDGRADLFVYNATADANHGRWFRILTDPFVGTIGFGNPPGGGHFVTYIEGDVVWRNDWTITPGDYDGDGRTDLFLYRPSGEWYRVFFTPNGARYERGVWSPGWTLSRGDFNGDGRTDLFVYNPATGRWYVVISEANGTLSYYGGVMNWSPGWQISVTDVNVDGIADLVLYNPADGRWYQAVTQTPGVFAFANGTWPAGLTIIATRPQSR